jgi:hypothetical protein
MVYVFILSQKKNKKYQFIKQASIVLLSMSMVEPDRTVTT